MSNEKRSSAELARTLDKNVMEASNNVKAKAQELRTVVDEAYKVYLAPDKLKKLPQEDQAEAIKQMDDISAKLSLARKSLERWQSHYQNTVAVSQKAKEALSKAGTWKTISEKGMAHASVSPPPKPSMASIPDKMKNRTSEPPSPEDKAPALPSPGRKDSE